MYLRRLGPVCLLILVIPAMGWGPALGRDLQPAGKVQGCPPAGFTAFATIATPLSAELGSVEAGPKVRSGPALAGGSPAGIRCAPARAS